MEAPGACGPRWAPRTRTRPVKGPGAFRRRTAAGLWRSGVRGGLSTRPSAAPKALMPSSTAPVASPLGPPRLHATAEAVLGARPPKRRKARPPPATTSTRPSRRIAGATSAPAAPGASSAFLSPRGRRGVPPWSARAPRPHAAARRRATARFSLSAAVPAAS